MSAREILFLGTSSQVPTRTRSHNSLFLRWDSLGILFDPGEGTQRQLLLAGVSTSQITHIAITHFHGDHCLGLAGIIQRISLDRVPHPIEIIYPESGQLFFERLRYASIYFDCANVVPKPFSAHDGLFVVSEMNQAKLFAGALDHSVECYGYRLEEQEKRSFIPEALEAVGVRGLAVRELLQQGFIQIDEKVIQLEDVSQLKPGQRFALIMDTRPCENALQLAHKADLLVCESTYLHIDENLAFENFHMTAKQAAILAKEAQAQRLALTHFSQRYVSLEPFLAEASTIHQNVHIAEDFTRVAVPKRNAFSS